MRTAVDFAPLFRSTIGFDRVLDTLDAARRVASTDTWPPYDIERTSEDEYRVRMAVAGFTESDLTITQEHNMLIVAGQKSGGDKEDGQYLHRGIAARPFQRRFELADHVSVVGASLVDGVLTIDCRRELPEEMKPQRVAIATGSSRAKGRTNEADKRAA